MTTIHNSTITVTLSPTTPNVTLAGTIDAIAPVGTYSTNNGGTLVPTLFDAAVFGPKSGHFTVDNIGTVLSSGGVYDLGILLGAAGTVINSGHITAGSGIAIFGGNGAEAINTGKISATSSLGIYLQGKGTVTNKGVINAHFNAIFLNQGGVITNTSTGQLVSHAADGIDSNGKTTIQNAGTIYGFSDGINLQQSGAIKNTGLIREGNMASTIATQAGIYAGDGATITNTGTITGGNGIKSLHPGTTAAALAVTNTGTILALSQVDDGANFSNGFLSFGVGIYTADQASITNAGIIDATHIGIVVENAIGTVTNAGLIDITPSAGSTLGYGIYLRGGGGLTNTGTIIGYSQGVFLYNSADTATAFFTNSGLIEATSKPFLAPFGTLTADSYSETIFQIGAGTIDNEATGTISASFGGAIDLAAIYQNFVKGIFQLADGTVINAGLVEAQRSGVYFDGIGGVTNTGKILAADIGVRINDSLAAVDNAGLINVTASSYIYGTDTVTASGVIYGLVTTAAAGILATNGSGTVTNTSAGTIAAPHGNGIALTKGGYVYNYGTITAGTNAIYAQSATAHIYNYATGTLAGAATGIRLNAGGVANNAGLVTGGRYGVELTAGGAITNSSFIAGAAFGIVAAAPTASTTIANSGIIEANATTLITIGTLTFAPIGIDLYNTGTITNTGTILGVGDAIVLGTSTAADLITNAGLIEATATTLVIGGVTEPSNGIFLFDGGTITNQAGATITGYSGVDSGLFLGAAGERTRGSTIATSITNAGLIKGNPTSTTFGNGATIGSSGAVILNAGGALTNEATGTISGHFGVYLSGGAKSITNTITNLGTIIGVTAEGVILGANASLTNAGLITGENYGVFAYAANQITNQSTGIITGGSIGILAFNNVAEPSTIANAGRIFATHYGIILDDGGAVQNTGTISATNAGIVTTTDPATVFNAGTIITSTATYNNGIDLDAGGLITNTGLIEGGSGIFAQNTTTIKNSGSIIVYRNGINLAGFGTITNSGLIDVTKPDYNFGINLEAGGLVTNTATIESGTGIYVKSGGTVVNKGNIASRNGIYLKAAGTIINAGTIDASATGIFAVAGGTITDSGLISIASTGFSAIYFKTGSAASSRLILSPTARFAGGTVQLNGGTLELAAAKTAGTIALAKFQNIGAITIDSKAIWDFTGTIDTSSSLTVRNDGTIIESPAALTTIAGALTGTGTIDLAAKPLTLAGPVAATQKIKFSGTAETLTLTNPTQFAATIQNFAPTDTINLSTISRQNIIGENFAAGILTLTESTGHLTFTFANPSTFAAETLSLFTNGPGTGITLTGAAALATTPLVHNPNYRTATLPEIVVQPPVAAWLTHVLTTPTSFPPPITL